MRDDPRRLDHALEPPGDGQTFGVLAFAERLVVAALRNGIERFRTEPHHWDLMLGFLDATERATVRRVLESRPPTIRYGYARDSDKWPIIGVVLASEVVHPDGEFLGDQIDVEIRGEIHTSTLDVTMYADHPDLSLYLYHWARYTLFAHVEWFENWVINPHFVSGGELAPDPRYLPETCYLRRQQWSFSGEASAHVPMPPPPRELYAMVETVAVAGHTGRVRPERP